MADEENKTPDFDENEEDEFDFPPLDPGETMIEQPEDDEDTVAKPRDVGATMLEQEGVSPDIEAPEDVGDETVVSGSLPEQPPPGEPPDVDEAMPDHSTAETVIGGGAALPPVSHDPPPEDPPPPPPAGESPVPPAPVSATPSLEGEPERNSMALASLISGLVGWVIGGIGGCGTAFAFPPALFCTAPIFFLGTVVATITGHIGRRQIKDRSEGGQGMATTGLILGWLGILVILLSLCLLVLAVGALAVGGPSIQRIFEDVLREMQP